MTDSAATNAPELSVSELSGALKRTIEDRFGYVRVRGEVSGWRGPHSSGHCYFCLKDETARLDAVIWKGTFARMRVRPEEGLEVIATGKVTTFPGKSSYQIVVETIEPAGIGALMALLEERRRTLAAEGLFDDARKQLIPFLPRVIGVVTSPTGAVIRDILHRLSDRFPVHVVVWPVRVQGETCAAEVARAINGFNALPDDGAIAKPDVIIVARGGGSLEDLWGFNDELVVRAAAASMIPLVSAVGHETDWTLIDHAADLRAPTPTGAAEMCVPVRSELLAQLGDLARRHMGAQQRLFERNRADLRGLVRILPSGEDVVAIPRQKLDRAGERLREKLESGLRQAHLRLNRAAGLLARHSPQAEFARMSERCVGLGGRLQRLRPALVAQARQKLDALNNRLVAARRAQLSLHQQNLLARRERLLQMDGRLQHGLRSVTLRRQDRLMSLSQLFESLSYKAVLSRGYAIVRNAHGEPVRQAAGLKRGDLVSLEFTDGQARATIGEAASPDTSRPRKAPPKADQGSLF
jgi:exodeoxyribonuclease VII large subunit